MINLKKFSGILACCAVSMITLLPAHAASNSIMSNYTREGTPDSTLKKALDTLYYGDANDASKYYITEIPNFKKELEKTQSIFIQTVERVTLYEVYYSKDGKKAAAIGEIKLKNIPEPTPVIYKFLKKRKKWKIIQ